MSKQNKNDMAQGMIEAAKSNLKLIVIFVLLVIAMVVGVVYNSFFGNPISKSIAEKNIKIYLKDTYPTQELFISEIYYNIDHLGYSAIILSPNSEDTFFTVTYSLKENKMHDNYSDVVTSMSNTHLRLELEYDRTVNLIIGNKYRDISDLYLTVLGKNQEDIEKYLSLDMPLDMENLPLESSLIIHINSNDITWQNLANTAVELDEYLSDNGIFPDWYDIVLKDNSDDNIAVYNFDAKNLQEENLANIMSEHHENWVKENKNGIL